MPALDGVEHHFADVRGAREATPRGYRKDELAEDVIGVLDALGIDRVDSSATTGAGIIGFLVCLEHPDRVAHFVPTNTGHVWPKLSLKGIPKQLGAMAYRGAGLRDRRSDGTARTTALSAAPAARDRWILTAAA